MQTTSDTSFAGHLLNRDYYIVAYDQTQKRKTLTFDITEEEFNRERAWYDKHFLADFRRASNALSAAIQGQAIKDSTVRDWPSLRVVLEGRQ